MWVILIVDFIAEKKERPFDLLQPVDNVYVLLIHVSCHVNFSNRGVETAV